MVPKRKIFRLLALLALGLSVTLSYVAGQGVANSQETRLDQRRFNELRSEGSDALYNLEYDRARQIFREMSRLFPDHPGGPQSLAATLWLEELNRARHLQASLYSTDSLQTRSEKVNPRVLEQFRQWIKEAKLLSEARLRRNPDDLEALYLLGAADGLQAVFTAGVEQRYRAALNDSSRAVERHKQVLKRDPEFHDAELTIGMFNYVVGSLPLPIKIVASIGGVRGSKKRGLEMLERVAQKGHWARDMARTLLIDIYKREKRWDEAASISRELAAKYPRNYLFRLQTADALMSQDQRLRQDKASPAREKTREALLIFESLLHGRTAETISARRAAADLIHYRYGEALLVAGEPDRASEEFQRAVSAASNTSTLATLARLRGAQSLDLAGQRVKAIVEYKNVLERPNVRRSHEEARRGLREPYQEN
jgi:tetratricopeptide (TPR) repeat protein